MSPNIKTIPTSAYDEVVQTVQKYVEGLRTARISTLQQAFHPNATMYGLMAEGKLLGGPIENLYTFVNEHGKAEDVRTRIDVLAITQTTAVVKVDMEKDKAGLDYTDFHTLIKLDGKWSIIAKTFHTYAAASG